MTSTTKTPITVAFAGRFAPVLLAAFLALSGAPALAQDHSAHGGTAPSPTAATASTKAFEEANARMHQDMAIAYTGDADIDFVKGMIPHHQGAIDMAKVVLAHGKDPEIRKLAEEVVAAQTKEIAMMKAWLAARGQ